MSANIIFAIDLMVRFFSSYIDVKDGREIFSFKAIAKNYLGGDFTFDFISTIPVKAIGVSVFGITNQNFIDLADMC